MSLPIRRKLISSLLEYASPFTAHPVIESLRLQARLGKVWLAVARHCNGEASIRTAGVQSFAVLLWTNSVPRLDRLTLKMHHYLSLLQHQDQPLLKNLGWLSPNHSHP